MENKRGFTLIELLAVIVILAIIALIATPVILNIIEKARKSAFQDSAYGLIEAAKLQYTEGLLDGTNVAAEYDFDGNTGANLVFSGTKPEGGKVVVDTNGNVGIAVHNGNWCAVKSLTKTTVEIIEYDASTCVITDDVEIPESNSDQSGANKPSLANGLIPIKWNGSVWIRADENNPSGDYQWYDYNTQMWANAASVTSAYRSVAVGTEIPESEINAYFVWIPRYEYDYVNIQNYAGGSQAQPGEIQINFVESNDTTPTTNYKIHPAFTFGGTELAGIWVGKFETTGSASAPTIKPNLSSLRSMTVSAQFTAAQLFSASGNNYGISTSADAHMMKNSEWGAVAYLSQSKYGKYGNSSYTGTNKEVFINNTSTMTTGCSAGAPSTSQSSSCAYTYEKSTGGTGASTTGTIYGVYDMSGGAWEYVMGNYNGTVGESVFSNLPASKYYDKYTTTSVTTACSSGICYGHSLSETNGWYSDYADFVTSSYPWFARGGGYENATSAGVFASNYNGGTSNANRSFRVVVLDL